MLLFLHKEKAMFSKACEYAIRALIYIAQQNNLGNRTSLKDIADAIESPEAFTAKILQKLVHNRIITSLKGPNGGFSIDPEKIEETKLIHIVSAIDGDGIRRNCALGLKECGEVFPCPLHHKFKIIREQIELMLTSTSLKALLGKLEEGNAFIKIPGTLL